MRKRILLLLPLALIAAAPSPPDSVFAMLDRAKADYESAREAAKRLQDVADRASGELERVRARHRAAASEIEAAEARITLAELRLRRAEAAARAQRLALAEAQRPAAALLAGMSLMAERPPLLAMIDDRSIDSLVDTRILLDSTLPVIRSRSKAFAARLASTERALRSAHLARDEVTASRTALEEGRRDFALAEQRLLELAAGAGSAAIDASDRALALGEASRRALGDYQGTKAIREWARSFASAGVLPPRPGSADGVQVSAPFAYRLPASALVTQGLGDVDRSGIRARGITLATMKGAPVEAPGSGTVRFAGPFLGFDGVLIIDHGAGWLTMLVNLSPQVRTGQKIMAGEAVGRALGPISVELYRNGKPYSPALIAGSSEPLSNGRKGG